MCHAMAQSNVRLFNSHESWPGNRASYTSRSHYLYASMLVPGPGIQCIHPLYIESVIDARFIGLSMKQMDCLLQFNKKITAQLTKRPRSAIYTAPREKLRCAMERARDRAPFLTCTAYKRGGL
jgi:hypothetical protein